jgi:hypothetical protein
MLRQPFENFEREKRDLPFVVVAVVVKTIAADSVAGDAFDPRHFDQGKIIRRPAVVPKVIVAPGDEDLPDLHGETNQLADAKANFSDDLRPEALLQFAQNFRLRDLLELVMQRRLQHPHGQNAGAQTDRRGVRGDKLADDLFPGINHFAFTQPFAQPELLHQLWQQIPRCLPPIWARFVGGKSAPLSDHGSA